MGLFIGGNDPTDPYTGKVGRGLGILDPEDLIDEQGATATAQGQATTAFQQALAQQQAAAGLQQRGADLQTYFGGLPSSADAVTAQQISGIGPILATTADWKQTAPIERVTASTIAPTRNVELGPVNTTVTGPGQIPISQASSTTAGRTVIDPLAGELRGQQLDAARAMLNGPSAADAAMKAGLATTAEEALGMAAQARGDSQAAARRAAILGMQSQGVKAAALGAQAKAQEEAQRKMAFNEALQMVRGQDTALATQQAQLDSQRNALNAQLEVAVSRGNAEAANAIRSQMAALDQAAKTTTMQAGLDAAKAAADVATSTAGRQSQLDLAGAQLAQQASAANAGAFNAQQENNATRATQTSQFNAGQANTLGATNVQNQIEVAGRNQQAALAAGTANQGANLQAQQQKTNALINALTAQTSALNAGTGAINAGTGAAGVSAGLAGAIIGGQAAQQAAEQASQERFVKGLSTAVAAGTGNPGAAAGAGGLGGGGSSGGGGKAGFSGTGDDLLPMSDTVTPPKQNEPITKLPNYVPMNSTSDERAKTNVRRISDDDLIQFAKTLDSARWTYKKGFEDNGAEEHAGVPSANKLERNPIGQLFVSKDENGVRHVDYPQMATLLTAAMLRREGRRA